MSLFWLEYLHFIAAIAAILVSISAFSLFFLTFRYEQTLRTAWRAIGFFGLAIAFFLYILERKFGGFIFPAIIVEVIAFYSIYKGVLAEPKLSQLRETTKQPKAKTTEMLKTTFNYFNFNLTKKQLVIIGVIAAVVLIGFGLISIFFTSTFSFLISFVPSILEIVALIFVAMTIKIQIARYKREKGDLAVERLNLYPLIAYIFLFARGVFLVFHWLPDFGVVFLHQMILDFSFVWQLAVWCTLVGFIFLGMWAWNFIKVRVFLKTYVVFLTIAIIVSTLGALVFTTLVFNIVEDNNLQLMEQGAETEQLIFEERANTALFIAKTMSDDTNLIEEVRNNNYKGMLERTDLYLQNSNLDILRIYNTFGEVIVSPSDVRDRGRMFNNDSLVTYTLTENKQVKSFESQEGILAEQMVARAIHPLIVGDTLIGAVETGYIFDNAFVDFSKEQTGLDVTIYTGITRAATTITTLDGVSRWVGTEETDKNVIDAVYEQGNNYQTILDRLGQVYYSAFTPVSNVNGIIIGMVSVGAPTSILFENTRQQLVSSFLIVTIISLLAALIGYYALFYKRQTAQMINK